MPDTFRAVDLTRDHIGRRIRVDGYEGVLVDLLLRDAEWLQLLIATEGMPPLLPTVAAGAPVAFLD